MPGDYRSDLAWIHHVGFSAFATSAAPGVLQIFARRGVTSGTIVEAGCGSGVLARELTGAGFDVVAFDSSPAMIALARQTAPAARFQVGTLGEAAMPPCDAIIAMGEVVNYAGLPAFANFVHDAEAALRAGGVLLFDAAERDSYPTHDERRIGGDDWSVIVIRDSDGVHLTRRILTFREVDGEIHRDEEVHKLTLFDREEITTLLRESGFRVARRRSYGTARLPKGHAVYCAVRS